MGSGKEFKVNPIQKRKYDKKGHEVCYGRSKAECLKRLEKEKEKEQKDWDRKFKPKKPENDDKKPDNDGKKPDNDNKKPDNDNKKPDNGKKPNNDGGKRFLAMEILRNLKNDVQTKKEKPVTNDKTDDKKPEDGKKKPEDDKKKPEDDKKK